jgi:glutamyl-tRNA synthetase
VIAVRFAADPGPLDLDRARLALINWLFARKHEGRFLLRIDDAGRARTRSMAAHEVEEDLAWLGLGWDVIARQSDRLALYAGAGEKLKAAGRLYPCFETASLVPSPAEAERRLAAGEMPHWRFKLAPGPVAWDDILRGRVEIDGAALGDPVVIGADGTPLDPFTSVVDDVELDISHVVESDRRLADTAVQLQIFAALGRAAPRFAHVAALAAGGGRGGVGGLRDAGIEPMAVSSLLARLGTAEPAEPRLRLADLVAEFDLARFDRAPAAFEAASLDALNAKLLQLMPFNAVAHRLPDGARLDFWEAVRPGLGRFAEVEAWWRICTAPIAPRIASEDADFLARAAELLPAEPLDGDSFARWVARLDALSGRRGEAALLPLRLALTGRENGPELRNLLPLLGRARALKRLQGKSA